MKTAEKVESRVLIVEDDPETAELERRALVRAGRPVDVVGQVGAALAALERESYAAIVLDYRLPDSDPWPVLEAARRSVPPIPVILVTAMGSERIAAEVLHRGGADYLIKTAGFWDQLAGAVERIVRAAEADRINTLLAALVESSDDAILSISLTGTILTWNAGAARLFGYHESEIVGRHASVLIPPDRAEEGELLLRVARDGETARQFETVRLHKDGTRVEVAVTVSPILDRSGRIICAADVSRDVSHRRKLEAQLRQSQKMDAIGQLAGGIAHDFKNLLTIINGYADLLLEATASNPELFEEISEIRRAGERADSLTRQLLAFSRKRETDQRVIDLNALVTDTEKMLRRLVGEDIELTSVLDPRLGRLRADPSQLELVLVNLAVNARDAMASGGTLTIETSNVELDEAFASSHVEIAAGSYVLMTVTDNGVGMDEATQARIFEPFFTTKEPGRGTGLGLSTVFGIVKQSDGHILVYSEPGRGTTFRIYLPRVEASLSPSARAGERGARVVHGETILLVEDEAQLRKLTRLVLERVGYLVIEATGGENALEALVDSGTKVDLLLTDVVMPGLRGPELVREIEKSRPGLKHLYLSGYTMRTVARNGAAEAVTPFLEKPFTPQALLSKVREVLES